jgi:hypothetical protein
MRDALEEAAADDIPSSFLWRLAGAEREGAGAQERVWMRGENRSGREASRQHDIQEAVHKSVSRA